MEQATFRKYYAHSLENKPPKEWQELSLHLQNVANLAKKFAESFQSGDWAYLAGLWHDLGKFLPNWQEYLFRQMGYQKSDIVGRPNHSTVGAVLSFEKFKSSPVSRILAYIIAGHHAGLPDWYQDVAGGALIDRIYRKSLNGSLDTNDLEYINKISEAMEKMAVPLPQSSPLRIKTKEEMLCYGEYFHLWIRMLFSCLVDADFLDTEAFMAPERIVKRGCYPSLEELSQRFDSFMEGKMKEAPDSIINRYRRGIFQQCKDKAKLSPGIYSLTVPTGGGKTLSSMAFALKHALKYSKKRIIVAIPYTSIIEQTVKVYRYGTDDDEEIREFIAGGTVLFEEDAVLEHHSNIDPDKEDQKSKLATENWDAPVFVWK